MTCPRPLLVCATAALMLVVIACTSSRGRVVGFWFEEVSYGADEPMAARLGGPLTASELVAIERIAREELTRPFVGLALTFSDRRDATYRVRVVQELRNAFRPKYPGPAGESRAIPGLGGQSAVNFRSLVSSAVVHAPEGATRADVVAAIGRGIGRTAVHELMHQLLGSQMVDGRDDPASYEFRSADRPEHFYGTLKWGPARPLLERRLGTRLAY